MSFRFTTAGESHGPGLIAIVEGLPAGLELSPEDIDRDLARRQLGHGRGGRMKIEKDRAEVVAGIRHGRTLGSPVALRIENRDYANWEERMNPWPVEAEVDEVHLPRPGHADLAGVQKYGLTDVRNVLERARARETAARVAAGALAKALLRELGVSVCSHVTRIGSVTAPEPRRSCGRRTSRRVDESPVRCLDAAASDGDGRGDRHDPQGERVARRGLRGARLRRWCPGSARTSPGRSASTAGWPRRSCRSSR